MPGLAPLLASVLTHEGKQCLETPRGIRLPVHTEVPCALPNLTNGVFKGTSPFPTGRACEKPIFSWFSDNVNSQETKDCVFR